MAPFSISHKWKCSTVNRAADDQNEEQNNQGRFYQGLKQNILTDYY